MEEEKEMEEIVAYTVYGEPLNKQQFIDAIDEARREVAEGKFVTHEECMKKMYSKYNGK
ncbi:MAG: hypothetical protein LBO74_13490 [Candidatus Symbiothrix sp.]|jgi:predicted transcriptional regulator|nr:hypothetical protein [Candidatus Symbiothrix sp.]